MTIELTSGDLQDQDPREDPLPAVTSMG